MDYMYSDSSEQQAVGSSSKGTGVSQDGKAYKLIKLNYDIVIVVCTVDPKQFLSAS